MSLDLSTINFSVNTKPLEAAAAAIGELVTNVGKLDKAARTAAQTEATLARAAKDSARANLDNAKAQDVRLKSTITADKADQQAATAIEKKTKATERASTAIKKNADMLQLQNDTYDFILEGFSKGDAKVLAMAKAAGQLSDQLKQVLTDIRQFSKNTFDQTETGLDRMVKSAKEASSAQGFLNNGLNLTSKQAKELSNDLDRLNIRLQHQGKSYQEITKEQAIYKQRFVEEANAVNRATSALAAVEKQRKDVVSATNYLTQAEAKMAAALNTSNAALDKAGTDSLVKYESALRKSGVSQDVATQKLATYKAQLAQVAAVEEKRRAQHLTRALTPQISDVAVSLWSGQSPLTVLLQQGAQINDMFQLSGVAAADFGKTVKEAFSSMLPSILTVVKGVGGLLVDGLTSAGNAVLGFVGKVTGMSGAIDGANKKLMDMGWTTAAAGVRGLGILMTTVFAAGAGAAVAGLVAIGVALKQTISENDKMAVSLGLTGAAMGLTFSTATDLSKSMQGIGVSTSDAMQVLSEMAKQGKLTSDDVRLVTKAAVDMKTYAGVAIEDTVKQFVKMKEKPVEAMIELARATGLVAPEVVKAIMELEDQGKTAEATSRAIEELARVNDEQVERMKESYNGFSLFMIDLGKGISKFFSDAFKDLFYASSPTEQLKTQLKAVDETLNNWGTMNMDAVGAIQMLIPGEKERLQLQRTQLLNQIALLDQEKQQYEVIQKEKQDKIAMLGLERSVSDELSKRDSKRSRKKDNLQDFTSNFIEEKAKDAAKSKNLDLETIKSNDALMESYKKLAQVEWESAQEKTKKDPSENYFATIMREATAASIKADDATKSLTASQVKLLEAVNDPRFLKLSKVQQETYLSTMAANAGKEQQIALTEAQADAEERLLKLLGKSSGIGRSYYTDMANMEKDAALLGKSREEIEELTRAIFMATPAWQKYQKALEAVAKSNIETKLQLANIQAQNMELDHNLAMVGLSEEAQKRLTTEFTKQRDLMKANAEYEKIRSDIMKDGSYGTAENKNKALANAASVYQATIAQINRKAVDDLFTYYTSKAAEADKKSFGSFADVLKQAGQLTFATAVNSLGELINNFDTLTAKQEIYNKARAEAQGDTSKLQKLDKAHAALQVKSYGDIAKSMKGFFKEGTTGYKVMGAAEKAFRVYEMAMAVKNNAFKLAAMWGEVKTFVATTAKMIAGVTAEESVKTATRVPGIFAAFMSTMGPWGIPAALAAMAAVGIAASGSSAPAVVTNQGTGTVFGDSSAKSESINNSLDILKDVNTLTMQYSEKMLSSLRSIENLMGGVTNLILRSSGIEAAASGITEGTKLPSVLDFGIVSKIPVVGKLVGSLFGTKTKITGQGVYAEDTKLEDVMSNGIEAGYYADINKKKKAFGFTYSNKNSTNKTIDDQLSKQFTLIIENFLDVIKSAAPVLGFTTDQIDANLKDFVVKIGKIDLKGLSGKEIQEKLTAVFGAAGDDMAKAALPGFEKFQKVGEGYLETVVRVAYATESLRGMMDTFGVSTVLTVDSAMGLVDAFGDLEIAMDKLGAYYDAFYTEAERNATLQRQLTREFSAQNLKLPTTKEEYRKLVEAQDLNTEAGRKMYAFLITLAPAFAEIVDAAEQLANARTDIIYRMMEQEAQLLATQGRTAEADKKRRELLDKQRAAEYERLMKINPELARLTAELWALEDAAVAAAKVKEIADTRQDLTDRILQQEAELLGAQGRTAEADKKRRELLDRQRARENERLMALNPELAKLAYELWLLEDATVAATKAAALEREISDNRRDYTDRILEQEAKLLDAQGRTAEADKKRRELLDRQRARENERLMALNPELAKLAYELWLLEDATEAATRAAKERTEISNDLYNALEKAVDAEKTLLDEQKSRLEETISTLKAVFDILKSSVEDLYGEVSSTAAMQASEGRGVIAQAIATGILPDSELLDTSIQAVRDEISNSLYVSKADADKARLIFAAQLALLKDTTEGQLTDAEKQLKAVNAQISYLDNILKTAKEQLDAFLGNTEVLKSVDKALADLYAFLQNPSAAKPVPKPVGTEKPGTGTGGGAVFGPGTGTSKPSTVNSDGNIVYADGSIGYRNSWIDNSGVKHYGFVSKDIWETERAAGTPGYPAFANGGYYQGGMALVGEEGPELINFSNPGQVYTARQTASMLSGESSEVVAELKAVRSEIIMLRAEVRADVSHNAKTAKLLDRVIPEGDSVQVTIS